MTNHTTATSPSAAINIGLDARTLIDVSLLLNPILADYAVLAYKAKNYHWNLTGIHFVPLHGFFGELYDTLSEDIDDIAERVRALDQTPISTMAGFLKAARLKEETRTGLSALDMIKQLLADTEELIATLRTDVEATTAFGDAGTADFLTGLMEAREKNAWMLRSLAKA
jgi:starvation-inducible DNA-binding protein